MPKLIKHNQLFLALAAAHLSSGGENAQPNAAVHGKPTQEPAGSTDDSNAGHTSGGSSSSDSDSDSEDRGKQVTGRKPGAEIRKLVSKGTASKGRAGWEVDVIA